MILRSILGLNITRDEEKRLKLNKELEEELVGKKFVIHIKVLRLEWLVQIIRRLQTEMVRRITTWTPDRQRGRRRPKRGWWDDHHIKAVNIIK